MRTETSSTQQLDPATEAEFITQQIDALDARLAASADYARRRILAEDPAVQDEADYLTRALLEPPRSLAQELLAAYEQEFEVRAARRADDAELFGYDAEDEYDHQAWLEGEATARGCRVEDVESRIEADWADYQRDAIFALRA